jgi:hydroxyquinol 1,2-dioxygenase
MAIVDKRDTVHLTQAVIDSFATTQDERLREILVALTSYLHDFVCEVRPSIEEWEYAIDFLTRTGQKCDDLRQEFILLSDVLGISMLTEILNDSETPDATDSTVLGPFHVVESPQREFGDEISSNSAGQRCVVTGRVTGPNGESLVGASIDVWHANMDGFYDVQQPEVQGIGNGRGKFRTDAEGRFCFKTVVPSFYPIPTDGPVGELLTATSRHPYRPAHIHFQVELAGYETLTTHIFIKGSPYIDSDAVFAVKESLIESFDEIDDAERAAEYRVGNPFRIAQFDIVLAAADSATDSATTGAEPAVDEGPRW